MSIILSQKQLDELVCKNCHKYLSVLPVKVYDHRIFKCGRCSKIVNGGSVSTYNKIAEAFLFKCINSYSGCRKLLKASEVQLHEKKCHSNPHMCPICHTKVDGSYQLIQHYKNQHEQNILLNKTLTYLPKDAIFGSFICVDANFIFLVNVHYIEMLQVQAISLENYGPIFCQYIVKSENEPKQESKFHSCSTSYFKESNYAMFHFANGMPTRVTIELVIDTSRANDLIYEIHCGIVEKKCVIVQRPKLSLNDVHFLPSNRDVELTTEFEKLYPEFKLSPCGTILKSSKGVSVELLCSNCKHMMGSVVYCCLKNSHLVCSDCRAWCGLCEAPMDRRKRDISSMAQYMLFPCRWKKCSQKLSGKDLRWHELHCPKNKMRCPECQLHFSATSLITHLATHFTSKKEYYFTHDFDFLRFLEFVKNLGYQDGFAYFLQNFKLVSIQYQSYATYRRSFQNNMMISYKPVENLTKADFCLIIDRTERHNLINPAHVNKGSDLRFYMKF